MSYRERGRKEKKESRGYCVRDESRPGICDLSRGR